MSSLPAAYGLSKARETSCHCRLRKVLERYLCRCRAAPRQGSLITWAQGLSQGTEIRCGGAWQDWGEHPGQRSGPCEGRAGKELGLPAELGEAEASGPAGARPCRTVRAGSWGPGPEFLLGVVGTHCGAKQRSPTSLLPGREPGTCLSQDFISLMLHQPERGRPDRNPCHRQTGAFRRSPCSGVSVGRLAARRGETKGQK